MQMANEMVKDNLSIADVQLIQKERGNKNVAERLQKRENTRDSENKGAC